MNKNRIKILLILFCIACVVTSICLIVNRSGADKTAPDTLSSSADRTSPEDGKIYPDEVKPYAGAIVFFESDDWNNWNEMVKISPLCTEEAFIQSVYYLGKINMDSYNQDEKGIQDIAQTIKDAQNALDYLIKSINGEQSYDLFEGSKMLSESIEKMNSIKDEAGILKEKYKEYFE